LQDMAGVLLRHIVARGYVEFSVNERDQIVECATVTVPPCPKKNSNLTRRGHIITAAGTTQRGGVASAFNILPE